MFNHLLPQRPDWQITIRIKDLDPQALAHLRTNLLATPHSIEIKGDSWLIGTSDPVGVGHALGLAQILDYTASKNPSTIR